MLLSVQEVYSEVAFCCLFCFNIRTSGSILMFLFLLIAEAVPFLLQGGGADHWVFSRSMVRCNVPSVQFSIESLIHFLCISFP